MKHTALALALAAGLIASPVAAAAQDPISQADQRDMECAALAAIMASVDPESQSSQSVGMAYYIGRLEGRNPGEDQVKRLFKWVLSQSEDDLFPLLEVAEPRCVQELQTLGTSMIEAASGG